MGAERFHITTSDGARLQAGYLAGPSGSERGFLLIPGFWGDWRRKAYEDLMEELARRGGVLAANMRGHPGSTGLFAFGGKEHLDSESLFGEARSRGMTDITAVGFSLGGWALASHLARCPHDLASTRHLVLVSTPARLPLRPKPWKEGLRIQMRRGGKGWVRPDPRFLWPPRTLRESLEALGDLPVSLVYAEEDWMVAKHHGETLYQAAAGPRSWVCIPDRRGLHAEMLAHIHQETILEAILHPPKGPRP